MGWRALTTAAPDRAELRRNRGHDAYASSLGQKAQRHTRPAGEPNRWAACATSTTINHHEEV